MHTLKVHVPPVVFHESLENFSRICEGKQEVFTVCAVSVPLYQNYTILIDRNTSIVEIIFLFLNSSTCLK